MDVLHVDAGALADLGKPATVVQNKTDYEIEMQKMRVEEQLVNVLDMLEDLMKIRVRHKLSTHRIMGVAREIKDLMKVIASSC